MRFDWRKTIDVFKQARTRSTAAKALGISESTVAYRRDTLLKNGFELASPWNCYREWNRVLLEIIPELLAQQRMRFGELVQAIRDSYGSVNRRTVHRWLAKLVADGVVERCGPKFCNDSYYVIAATQRSHRSERSDTPSRSSSVESFQP